MSAPVATERVLPTLNQDGSRNWIRPRLSTGKWWHRRRLVAYALIVLFVGLPYLHINGKPAILLDVPRREFTIFGTTFLPTDTLLLMLLLASLIIAIFLFSALFGRVWCGWGCPQTVYLEFLFRPIERLFEGGTTGSLHLDRQHQHFNWRRVLKNVVYLALSAALAHVFLAYFVGVEALERWIRLSPYQHPVPFVVMAVTTALIFLDFAWFREQTCLIACPYGRWQSVMLDKQSLVVSYDYRRGEPRMRGKVRPEGAGDCVECRACVSTCPTGIDIRNGLQMECVHCTQCMDACDAIMDQVGKPRGLIRYASGDTLAGKPAHLLRPRVIVYPVALALFLGAFGFALTTRARADVTVLRSQDEAFSLDVDGRVSNQVRIRVGNRSRSDHRYTITVLGADSGTVIAPESPLPVKAGELRTTSLFVVLRKSAFANGERVVTIHVTDSDDFNGDYRFTLLGPVGGGGSN